jgi:aminoglycoside phosphotransferase family enzyme/predicted kinase
MQFEKMTAGDQSATVSFLSDPKTYGIDHPVQVHQTHGSFVFLAGERAYKLKRAVKFPYMDYSTPGRRRRMCERELVVNQGMAPALYESVRSIVKDKSEWRFGPPDDEKAVDWVVVMLRFDQADLFEEMRKAGGLDISRMLALAEVIAAFHRDAPISHSFGGAAGIRAVIDENVAILKNVGPEILPQSQVTTYAELSENWLRNLRALLGLRRRTGFVRQCHGDLHLNNICIFEGKPTLFDAIEFADAFSSIDVMYDLAFILMDLDSHGMRAHANALLNHYLDCSGDYSGLSALPLFLACRAAIRAHVTIALPAKPATTKVAPATLLESALSYLAPDEPQLVVVGGLSGTGKSVLAQSLAPAIGRAPGAIVLRSDVIRKAMFRVPQNQRLDESAYSAGASSLVYDRMLDLAATALRAGHSVIADAVFGDDAQRNRIEILGKDIGVQFNAIWLSAPRDVLEERLAHRQGDASDADVKVLEAQLASVSVPEHWAQISSASPASTVLADAKWALGTKHAT